MEELNFNLHFKDLFEHSSDLIHFLTLEGNIELVNSAWLNTLGYSLNEVKGRSIYEFIHPDFVDRYKISREEVINNTVKTDIEFRYLTKAGKTILVEGQVGCTYNNEVPLYTRGVFKDVTFKKEAERKIRENENQLAAFFESAPDAIVVINQNQAILRWNPKAETIFGFTAKEVFGKPLSETIIPHQYREAHIRGMNHFLKTGEGPILNKTIEITALHKNGTEFYVNLSISSVKINRKWFFVAFISDITDRKNTEAVLIRKEAELLQSKLLDEKKNEFISIASHELKTPLTTIKAFNQVALSICNKTGNAQIAEYLKKVDLHTSKLTYLINELLDVSKINADGLGLSFHTVDLDVYLNEILYSIQHITPTHKLTVGHNAAVKASIDPIRLEQVIVNLISNAARYSPNANEIIINSIVQNDKAIISVTDRGIGIPQENLQNVFSRFFRVEAVAKEFSGLGIGLFIAAQIIKLHGGKIWAESTEGKGSTFFVSLPALK